MQWCLPSLGAGWEGGDTHPPPTIPRPMQPSRSACSTHCVCVFGGLWLGQGGQQLSPVRPWAAPVVLHPHPALEAEVHNRRNVCMAALQAHARVVQRLALSCRPSACAPCPSHAAHERCHHFARCGALPVISLATPPCASVASPVLYVLHAAFTATPAASYAQCRPSQRARSVIFVNPGPVWCPRRAWNRGTKRLRITSS